MSSTEAKYRCIIYSKFRYKRYGEDIIPGNTCLIIIQINVTWKVLRLKMK